MLLSSSSTSQCGSAFHHPNHPTPRCVAHATFLPRQRRRTLHKPNRASPSRPHVQCDVAVGIDLGTTSSAIALIRPGDGQPYILHDNQGKAIVPSVVAYTHDGEVAVGTAAQNLLASKRAPTTNAAAINSSQAQGVDKDSGAAAYYYSVKRLMGRQLDEIQDLAGKLPYPVVNLPPEGWAALTRPSLQTTHIHQHATGTNYMMLPQEVSAHVLRHLLERAEVYLTEQQQNQQQNQQAVTAAVSSPEPFTSKPSLYPPLKLIREAVITVPAHYSAAARKATIEAGRMAGLSRVELLQEPIAAALAYGFGVGGTASSSYDTLLVFDLGGGTFDVSLLEGWDGILEVLVTDGDNELGGDDLTRTLADLILSKAGSRPLAELPAYLRLAATRLAEDLKLRLSQATDTSSATTTSQGGGLPVQVPTDLPLTATSSQQQVSSPAQIQVATEEVETAWAPLLQRLWPPLQRLATSSCLQYGGRLPDAISNIDQPIAATSSTDSNNTDNGRGGGKVLAEHPLFVSEADGKGSKYSAPPRRLTGVVLVGAATRTPAVRQFMMQLCGRDPAGGADPEEVVALGAALQAGVLSGAVGRGAELTDGGYIASEHGRSTGWSSDVEVEWRP